MSSLGANTPVTAGNRIPAHAIFHEGELKQYYRWQRLHTTYKPGDLGHIPTATEYDDFRQWQLRQDSGYFSDPWEDISSHLKPNIPDETKAESGKLAATICHHNLHPVLMGRVLTRCPVCTVNAHLDYMSYLTRVLEEVEGRSWARARTKSSRRGLLHSAWRWAKLATMQELSILEQLMEKETQWASERPDVHLQDLQTAENAIHVYWDKTAGTDSDIPHSDGQRKVHFTGDLNHQPSRPQDYYCTRSPRYTPGKYAATSDTKDSRESHIENGLETDPIDSEFEQIPDPAIAGNDQLHIDHVLGDSADSNGSSDGVKPGEEDEDESNSSDSEDDSDNSSDGDSDDDVVYDLEYSLDSDVACDFIVFGYD